MKSYITFKNAKIKELRRRQALLFNKTVSFTSSPTFTNLFQWFTITKIIGIDEG